MGRPVALRRWWCPSRSRRNGSPAAAALEAVNAYFVAWNTHDPKALANTMHYPHVRLADSAVEVWNDADAFLLGPEPGRQRTWPSTTAERAEVVQVNATAANVTLLYTRRGRDGQAMSSYQALIWSPSVAAPGKCRPAR